MIKTILKHAFRLVGLALNGSRHWCILFEFLPLRRKEQDGVVVGFAEGMAGEGFVCIAEVRVAEVEGIAHAHSAIIMLVEFR